MEKFYIIKDANEKWETLNIALNLWIGVKNEKQYESFKEYVLTERFEGVHLKSVLQLFYHSLENKLMNSNINKVVERDFINEMKNI